MIPQREIAPGVAVAAIGFGGYHLGMVKDEAEAIRLLHAAIDAGITFLDNAWEYNEHVSEERMGKALAGGNRRDKVFLMTKVCTHGRGADVGMQQLEESLRRLRTDHLDLWQVHECVYDDDPARHYAKGGVLEAVERAKRDGKVRFVGFTGHKHPSIHREMIERGFPFDTAQMPLNVLDPNYRSFEKNVLPLARERGIHVDRHESVRGRPHAGGRPYRPGRRAALRDVAPRRPDDGNRHRLPRSPRPPRPHRG